MGFRRRIYVEGLNLERFIQHAGESGSRLSSLKRCGARRISAIVDERHMSHLCDIASNGGWMLTEGGRIGSGRITERLVGRWLLIVIIAFSAIGLTVSSQFVWRIEVHDAGAYAADIGETLKELGVHVPMARAALDIRQLRDVLEWRYPRVAWVECGLRGMSLSIRMVEGVNGESETLGDGPCDVVAARTGIVQRIETKAGTAVVKPGDLVAEGDVLIRGEERTSGGGVRAVAARGRVYARVWDSAAVKTSLRVFETEPTGRKKTVWNIRTPWFLLWRDTVSSYVHQDISVSEIPIGGFFWPFTIRKETRIETDFRSDITDYRSVLNENNQAASQKLFELIGGKESLVDIWVNWSIIEDEILLSVATGERLTDIARQERSSGMAVTE